MVWINTDCHNHSVPEGVFGGAMCVCVNCRLNRLQESLDDSKPLPRDKRKELEDKIDELLKLKKVFE